MSGTSLDLAALVAQTPPDELAELVADFPPDVVSALLAEFGADPDSLPATPLDQAMILDESYRERDHLTYVSERIAQAVEDVENGTSRRLIIEMPPRTGKTYLATQITSLWTLRRHSDWQIALTSHDGTLAAQWGRQVRRWIENGKAEGIGVAKDAGAVKEWETTEGGGVLSRSVRESLTGRGARVLVIDDPHKDFVDAHSATFRAAIWDWWLSVAQTRLEPPSLVIVIMCMTGDTPVLRPDGSETPLRDIRPGDEIATYEDGRLTTSRVLNWANQGPDDIFSIRMKSGRTVRANARHPFLTVDDQGAETWQRTDQLKPGVSILTATGESIAVSNAPRTDAANPRSAGECVCRTTTALDGPQVIALPRSTRRHDETPESSTAMGSRGMSTTASSKNARADVTSAENSLQEHRPHTGQESSASTTTTIAGECAACSAMTATCYSSGTSPQTVSGEPLTTWSVTPDEVVSVESEGREDVYDLQVERTENFIANGLVSHNTRWHEDDLVGRLLSKEYEGDPAAWERIRLPALADTENDPIGRELGEPLLSPLFTETREQAVERWAETRTAVGEYVWSALYQQSPSPAKGAIFDMGAWRFWTTDPALATRDDEGELDPDGKTILLDPTTGLSGARWLDSWDMAFKDTKNSDYVVGQRWAKLGERRFLVAQSRGRRSFTSTIAEVRAWVKGTTSIDIVDDTARHVHQRLVEDKANGTAIINALRDEVAGIKPINPRDGKEARARSITPEIESGHFYLPHPSEPGHAWVKDLLSELRNFPHDAHDDQVDALTQAATELRSTGKAGVTVPGGRNASRGQQTIKRGYTSGQIGRRR